MQDILEKVQADHDRDPQAAAAALRGVAPEAVPYEEITRYTWLVNHVIGEKLGAWNEVQGIYRARGGDLEGLPVPALRNVAAAAALSGDAGAASAAIASLARAAHLEEFQAALVLEMAKIMYGMPAMAQPDAATRFAWLCDAAMGWKEPTGADTLIAGMTNNVTSAWLETPQAWSSPLVRGAMGHGARASRHFWGKCGTWVQQERADYLVAMVMNRIGKFDEARRHALAGIEAIDRNGGQDVDLAFHRLELAYSEKRLGRASQAVQALASAQSLAAGFADDGLKEWFADTKAELEALNPEGGA